MKTLLHNGTVLTPAGRIESGWLLLEGDKIAALGQGPPPVAQATRRIDAAGRFIAPGKDADVILFDQGVAVSLTLIGGEVAYQQ